MAYGEYTEDWRFHDRAPLCSQVYPDRSHLSQQQQPKTNRESAHTRVSFGVGALGFPLTPKTSLSPPPPQKCFFSLALLKSINKGI